MQKTSSISYVESVISTPGHDVQYYDLNDKRQAVWTEYDGNDYENMSMMGA